MSCELAVAAALGALPSHHAPIARIQFLYGSLIFYFPALLPSDEQGTIGYVLFTYEDGSRDYVDVAEFHGELSASAPMPYPQTSASQARPSRPGEDRPAVLSIEDRSSGLVLVVDGVLTAPADLPVGAWVKVSDQEVADMAVLAGYHTEPPRSRKRRRYSGLGRFYATVLIVGAMWSLVWVVRELLELDVLGALAWLGLGCFLGIIGLGWWFAGEEIGLEEEAQHRRRAARFWAAVKGSFGARGPKR